MEGAGSTLLGRVQDWCAGMRHACAPGPRQRLLGQSTDRSGSHRRGQTPGLGPGVLSLESDFLLPYPLFCPQHLSCTPGAGPGWPMPHSLPATRGGIRLSLVACTWCLQLLGSILERKGTYSSPLCSFLLAENSVCCPDPEQSAGSTRRKPTGWKAGRPAQSLTLRAPAWVPWM